MRPSDQKTSPEEIKGVWIGATTVALLVGVSYQTHFKEMIFEFRDVPAEQSENIGNYMTECTATVTGLSILENAKGVGIPFDRAAIADCIKERHAENIANEKWGDAYIGGGLFTLLGTVFGALGGGAIGGAVGRRRNSNPSPNGEMS